LTGLNFPLMAVRALVALVIVGATYKLCRLRRNTVASFDKALEHGCDGFEF